MNVTRAFPAVTQHPRRYLTLSELEAAQLSKNQMESGRGIVRGHDGTVVSYTNGEVRGFVVEVKYDVGPTDIFLLPCSFEPTFGIDRFDGMRIEDVEAFSLVQRLNWTTDRLDVFQGKDEIETTTYLRLRNYVPHSTPLATETATHNSAQINAMYTEAVGIVRPLISVDGTVGSSVGNNASKPLQRAITLLSHVTAASPTNASAFWFSGKAHQLLNQLEEALEQFTKAAERNVTQNQFAIDAFGIAFQLGRSAQAVRFSQQAAKNAPNDPELLSNLAIALLISGDKERAAAISGKALKMRASQKSIQRINAVCSSVAAGKYPNPRNAAEVLQIAKSIKL